MCAKTQGISRQHCRSSRGTGGQEHLRNAIRICRDRHAPATVCPGSRCTSTREVVRDTHGGRRGEHPSVRGEGDGYTGHGGARPVGDLNANRDGTTAIGHDRRRPIRRGQGQLDSIRIVCRRFSVP
jgi:hypothetical protein